ncbi:two-component sensor histidine kinase [Nitrospirillum amazonense]|uniref:histidine kinase n=2 Tax=Nitrospirillum amazonense TaxID=28077 RepID=A0A560JE13_9PROT|nr:two-component sensor histidine kinase [Nitrospirillum amazonense]
MDMLLRQRVRLAGLAALGGIVALLLIMQSIFAEVVSSERWVNHSHQVRTTATLVLSHILSAESAQRLYLLVHAPEARDRFQGYRDDTTNQLLALTTLLSDNPDQVRRASTLTALANARLDALQVLMQAPAGSPPDTITLERGESLMAEVREQVAIIDGTEQALLVQRQGRVNTLRLLFVAGSVVICLVAGGLVWRLSSGAMTEADRESRMRQQLQDMLDEKGRLLREINHRVGNGLSMIGTLLQLQTHDTKDPQAERALAEARTRVLAINEVHKRMLQAETVDEVEFGALLPAFCREVAAEYGALDRVQVTSTPVLLPVETGVALALILNEMLTPTLRRSDELYSPVQLTLAVVDNRLSCIIDDPSGQLPTDMGAARLAGIGMTVVQALCRQIGAEMAFDKAGTQFYISITVPRARKVQAA